MIICAYTDCNYSVGWVYSGADENKRIEPPEGEFYDIRADFKRVTAERYHGDKNHMILLGCPKCNRVFITEGEVYSDDNTENSNEQANKK